MEHSCDNFVTDSEGEYSSDSCSSQDEYCFTQTCSECGVIHTPKTFYRCAMCGIVVCCFCFNEQKDYDDCFGMSLEICKGHRVFTCTKFCLDLYKKR